MLRSKKVISMVTILFFMTSLFIQISTPTYATGNLAISVDISNQGEVMENKFEKMNV